jgi:hypothetical protein
MTANKKLVMLSDGDDLSDESLLSAEQPLGVEPQGELRLSDYVHDVPASPKTTREVAAWANRYREVTRRRIAMWLVRVFASTMAMTFLLAGVGAFCPGTDKEFIKDLLSLVITPQSTLLGVALTFYFTTKEEDYSTFQVYVTQ